MWFLSACSSKTTAAIGVGRERAGTQQALRSDCWREQGICRRRLRHHGRRKQSGAQGLAGEQYLQCCVESCPAFLTRSI